MTVFDCKGLEFDTVYVLDYDMTDNEKYVAYTRALDTLVVIPDDLKAIQLAEEEAERKRREEERKLKEQERILAKQNSEKEKKSISGSKDLLGLLCVCRFHFLKMISHLQTMKN